MSSRTADASAPGLPAERLVAASPLWRIALVAGAALTFAIVVWAGQQDPAARAARQADPDLLMILRLMAAIKAGAAIALLWLAQWRLRRAARPAPAIGMVAAGMLMVSGPALIGTMAGIALGALAFYVGLAALGALLWSDRAAILGMLAAKGGADRSSHDLR
jgi:hypothetical protein